MVTGSPHLCEEIIELGLVPIVTSKIIRAVYEGPDEAKGKALVKIFEKEVDHDIVEFHDSNEDHKAERKAARKAERADRNAKLHGH